MSKHLWLGAIGLVVYSGFIFFLSSIPSNQIPSGLPLPDKLLHFFLYAGLGLIFAYFLNNLQTNLTNGKKVITTLFLKGIRNHI